MQFVELHFWHNPFFIQARTISSAVRSRIQYRLNVISFGGLHHLVHHQYNSVTESQSFIQLKVGLEGQIYQPVVSHNMAQVDFRETLSES
jgi:hypothetical protein